MARKLTTLPTWEIQKANLKKAFPKLTAEDLNFTETLKKEMLARLEIKVGLTANELEDILMTRSMAQAQ